MVYSRDPWVEVEHRAALIQAVDIGDVNDDVVDDSDPGEAVINASARGGTIGAENTSELTRPKMRGGRGGTYGVSNDIRHGCTAKSSLILEELDVVLARAFSGECRKNGFVPPAGQGPRRLLGALLGAFVLSVSLASCSIPGTEVTPDPSSGETVVSSPVSPPSKHADDGVFSPEDFDWGEYPPKNFEGLRDLEDPVYPEAISTYTLESSSATLGVSSGSYIDLAAARPMTATVYDSPSNYGVILEGSQNVEYIDDVVCGNPEGAPQQLTCLMVGQVAIFVVRLPSDVPMQEAAALTAEIYDLL